MNLITDRTAADVERYLTLRNKGFANLTSAEKTEWLAPMKGAYNYTDLNRVEEAVQYLANKLRERGYSVDVTLTKTTWTMNSLPTLSDMNRYLDNIKAIRSAFATLSTTPQAPSSMKGFTYKEANAIEQIIIDVNQLLENLTSVWFFSGDLFSGEV
jgi:hypothetical protein